MDILIIIAGLALLSVGAEFLIRGAVALAFKAGITPLMVGLTVVALGTSSPEIVVGIKAAIDGNGGIAVGSVIGSNICNIGLILAVGVLIRPISIDWKAPSSSPVASATSPGRSSDDPCFPAGP